MNNKIVNKFVNLPFVISGIIFLVSGILLFNHTNNFINNSQKAEAVISNISCVEDDCTAIVEFNVGNIKYSGELSKYTSMMKKGDNVLVYYNPSSPDEFKCGVTYTFSYLFIAIGTLITLASLFFMVKTNMKYKKYTNVKLNGIKIDAKIISIDVDNSISEKGVNPYYITCLGINPISRKEETFISENLWFDVRKVVESNNITSLPVFIDDLNSTNYNVDTSLIKKFNK